MEPEWVNLDSDEEVLWSGSPRVKSIVSSLVVGVPLIAVFGLGLLVIAAAYLNVKNTNYLVTDKALYVKRGILSRSVKKIGFDKVQNINYSQGVLGNRFGYGNIEISTAGGSGTEMAFRSVEDPRKVEDIINSRMETGSTGGNKNPELEELREIRKQLEKLNRRL